MKAKLTDGGILISGRGRWSSGCDHAEWAIVGAKVPDITDSQYPERNPLLTNFLVHRNEYTIDDTWYSMGMRGSGSKDLVFDNVFVPTYRIETMSALNFEHSRVKETIDSWVSSEPYALFFAKSFFLP